jgi:hypothetical protein
MATRIFLLFVALPLLGARIAGGAETDVKSDKPKLPAILELQPVKEDRPDIDSKAMSEINRLRRARYNVAIEETQTRAKLFLSGRIKQSDLLDAFKRLRSAEYGMADRARDGHAGVTANSAWLGKELEFLTWLEGVVQSKFNEGTEPRHALLEVQYYLLDAQQRAADQHLSDKASAEK